MHTIARELTFGYWLDGSGGRWVTFYEDTKTPSGTINERDILGSYGSVEEAKLAIGKDAT